MARREVQDDGDFEIDRYDITTFDICNLSRKEVEALIWVYEQFDIEVRAKLPEGTDFAPAQLVQSIVDALRSKLRRF